MPEAPATICRMKRSCPGTSMTLTTRPSWRCSGAKPSSIVIPRFFSSSRRSQSTPVRAEIRVVFPWSMCPAVPMTRQISFSSFTGTFPLPREWAGLRLEGCKGVHHDLLVPRLEGPDVQHQRVVPCAGDDGTLSLPQ